MADVTPILRRNRTQKPVNPSLPKAPPCNPDMDALVRLKNLVRRGDGFIISDTPEYMEGTGYRIPNLIAGRLHQGDFSIQEFIDLHGLSVRLAGEVIDVVCRICPGRTVRLVHGQGHHSGGRSVLRDHVREEVEYRGLRVVDLAAGHVDVIP